MPEFKLPPGTLPTRRHDQILVALVTILGLLFAFGILFFIAYGPHAIVDQMISVLKWAIVLIVLCVVVIDFLALRRTFERVRQDLTFVLNESELIRKRPGFPDVQISLAQIVSLYEQSGCLVIAGGDPLREPLRRIAVPKKVENFEQLKSELLKYSTPAPPPRRSSLGWVTSILTIICWALLIFSDNIYLIRVAGGSVLILLAEWSFELRHRLLHSPKRIALWILVGSYWLLAGCVIYLRIFEGKL